MNYRTANTVRPEADVTRNRRYHSAVDRVLAQLDQARTVTNQRVTIGNIVLHSEQTAKEPDPVIVATASLKIHVAVTVNSENESD